MGYGAVGVTMGAGMLAPTCDRAATRYDKFAANYLALIQLASIRLWLRLNESTT